MGETDNSTSKNTYPAPSIRLDNSYVGSMKYNGRELADMTREELYEAIWVLAVIVEQQRGSRAGEDWKEKSQKIQSL